MKRSILVPLYRLGHDHVRCELITTTTYPFHMDSHQIRRDYAILPNPIFTFLDKATVLTDTLLDYGGDKEDKVLRLKNILTIDRRDCGKYMRVSTSFITSHLPWWHPSHQEMLVDWIRLTPPSNDEDCPSNLFVIVP